jgi:alcohol dehydrogenase class IV
MRFELATPTRVLFGAGALQEAGPIARALGKRALLVVGRSRDRAAGLLDVLDQHGVGGVILSVKGEPSLAAVRDGTGRAKVEACDLVIGFGGGSAIDAAKAIAALLGNGGDPLDYVEIVGRKQPLVRRPMPWIAIPTTAGTGAEVTRNAVLTAPEHKLKVSLRSPLLPAQAAIVDPDLLASLPPEVIAAGGVDAFTQLVEPFVSVRANPLTDALCREGLGRSARSLRRAYGGDFDAAAREDLALASLFGGLALSNAGLGAVHGFAAAIGGAFDAPHGAVCAALLATTMEVNWRALATRAPSNAALPRYAEIATIVTGHAGASVDEGIAWVRALCATLRVPGLTRWGVTDADVESLVAKARNASSMRGNPIELADGELEEILTRSL